jgi:hypothetical protein
MRYGLALLLRSALIALVVLTALGLGVARGQAPVAGHVVLCGSFGTAKVAVDAAGNPVTAPGHCPDCAGLLLVPLAGSAVTSVVTTLPARSFGLAPVRIVAVVAATCPSPPARGPPVRRAA